MILCLDFDGVIHDYREGWKDGSVYGKVMPGFFPWALEARHHFKLVIYSSRSKTPEGVAAMKKWLMDQWLEWCITPEGQHVEVPLIWDNAGNVSMFEFASEKPPAFLTIDDRAVCFDGDWAAPHFTPAKLREYRTWSQRTEPC